MLLDGEGKLRRCRTVRAMASGVRDGCGWRPSPIYGAGHAGVSGGCVLIRGAMWLLLVQDRASEIRPNLAGTSGPVPLPRPYTKFLTPPRTGKEAGVLAHLSRIVYPFAMHDRRVLVTGGAGYIGSHTVAALLQAGWEVWVVDDLSSGHREVVPPEATFVRLDLRDEVNLRRVLAEARPAAVIHFAGKIVNPESFQRPLMYYDINVGGTLSLLRAMRATGVRWMVFSSSAAVYGKPETQPISEDTPCAPLSPYGRTKRMVEEMLEDLDRADILRFASLRYFNAAGADEEGRRGERHRPETHLIPRLLQAAAGDRDVFPLYGTDHPTSDGTAIRDYVHVEDLAAAHVRALEVLRRTEKSLILNVGGGKGHSVREVIEAVERITGRPIPVEPHPARPGDAPVLVADIRRARDVLGWRPRRSDLDTILRTAWTAYRRTR